MAAIEHTTKREAIQAAQRAADRYSLPQTVFKGETGGYWHTAASVVDRYRVKPCVTMLPQRYFI